VREDGLVFKRVIWWASGAVMGAGGSPMALAIPAVFASLYAAAVGLGASALYRTAVA